MSSETSPDDLELLKLWVRDEALNLEKSLHGEPRRDFHAWKAWRAEQRATVTPSE